MDEMKRPKDGEWYAWDAYVKWAKTNEGVEAYEDLLLSWPCWVAGYCAAMNQE